MQPTHGNNGLTQSAAARRLAEDGPNELPNQGPRSFLNIVRDVLTEPMFLLLIAAAAIYLTLGELRDASVLACSIFVVVGITVLQERRTESALARLKDLSSPRALVIRDGVEQRIAGREVVVGDVLLLREGDRVPADAVLHSATELSVDESILSGESLPVDKIAATPSADGESTRVYSGSLVVRGYGSAQVTATGARSEIGTIGRALSTVATEPSPLLREIRRIVRWIAGGGLLLCLAIAVIYAIFRNDWLGGVLAGITVAMGVVPEEFPLVLTVFLAMGAWRISRVGVLTRRMSAVESIGAATVLAVDKTGTLTENQMRLALVDTLHSCFDLRQSELALDRAAEHVLCTALAACERNPFDPMERAIHEAAQQRVPGYAGQLTSATLLREYDLTPELLAVTHVWQRESGLEIAAKGAPETILEMCRIKAEDRAASLQRVAEYAGEGLRVLGVAQGTCNEAALPDSPRDFEWRLLGFVCLADPLRQDVPAALAECTGAGIRVVMITGDHAGTALAIAKQAGFDTSGGFLTGGEAETLDDASLCERAGRTNIYARFKPQHKLRLVEALKKNGEIVVMTGDGVNDAPALKSAHVGVAMGERGTDVAREAAALVLVKDDFTSIVAAVRLGRRIYDNILHAMSYIIAVHIPIAGLGLAPVLFGWPLLFFPVHVLFLEFIIDPACAFVFEADPEPENIMRRRPRAPNTPLFSRGMVVRSTLLGLAVCVLGVGVYGVALDMMGEHRARALAFLTIVSANLALIFVSRSQNENLAAVYARPNVIFWGIAAATFAALLVAIRQPAVASLFKFSAPSWPATAFVMLTALLFVLLVGKWSRQPEAEPTA